MKEKKVGALGGKVWTSILLFGLIGQIAWVVENMYFSRFMQNEITRAPYATTLMVVFSAIFATVSTLIGGALCAITVDGVFLKADREMKKVFYELNEEKL